MTLFELAAENGDRNFRIGKSKVIWESATVLDSERVRITRICSEGGKPFLMGLRYKMRIANPDSDVHLVNID